MCKKYYGSIPVGGTIFFSLRFLSRQVAIGIIHCLKKQKTRTTTEICEPTLKITVYSLGLQANGLLRLDLSLTKRIIIVHFERIELSIFD